MITFMSIVFAIGIYILMFIWRERHLDKKENAHLLLMWDERMLRVREEAKQNRRDDFMRRHPNWSKSE